MATFRMIDRSEVKQKSSTSDLPAVDTGFAYVGAEQMIGDFDFFGTVTDDMPVEVMPYVYPITQAGEVWKSYSNLIATHAFEGGIGSWATGGSNSIAQSNDYGLSGIGSLKSTYQNDLSLCHYGVAVEANTAYIAIFYVYIPTNWDGGYIRFSLKNFTDATLDSTTYLTTKGSWQRVVGKFTSGTDVNGRVSLDAFSPPSVGRVVYVDNTRVVKGSDFFPSVGAASYTTNAAIRNVATGNVAFYTERQTLLASVDGKVSEVFTCPTPIRQFDVFDGPNTIIAIMDSDHLYAGLMSLDQTAGVLYNTFRMSRFTRLPLVDTRIRRFRCDYAQANPAVYIETEDDRHFYMEPLDNLIDLSPLYVGSDAGYLYVIGSNLNSPVTMYALDWWMDRHHPGAGNTKYLYVQVKDDRGVPTSTVTVTTSPFVNGISSTWGSVSADMTIYGTGVTDAQGIARFTVTYVKSETDIGNIDIQIRVPSLGSENVIASRAYGVID